MLLALDVGNTETVIGLFGEAAGIEPVAAGPDRGRPCPPPIRHWRVATRPERTADEQALLVTELLSLPGQSVASDLTGIAVCSSVPSAASALLEMAERWFDIPCVVIGPGVTTGLEIGYDHPPEVGADRIANAVGAYRIYGGPAIVVDLGTATTFDVIDRSGCYLGGAIAPGIEIGADALFSHAAALARVELFPTGAVIGRSTVESIRSGVGYGAAALVDGLCRRITAELGEATVIATGGLAGRIAPICAAIEHLEPWLTLQGLRMIYELNVPGRERTDPLPAARSSRSPAPRPRSEPAPGGPAPGGPAPDHWRRS
jgi:type III pantothenate kinase